jgi:hypothetical protein
VVVDVAEVERLGRTDGSRDRRERGRVDHGPDPPGWDREHGAFQCRDPVTQPGRQHLLNLHQRPQCGFRYSGHAADGGGMQADNDGHRLVVVQQQRRQRGAGREPVAAYGAHRGVDRIAQLA